MINQYIYSIISRHSNVYHVQQTYFLTLITCWTSRCVTDETKITMAWAFPRQASHSKITSYAGLPIKICLEYAINMCCDIQMTFHLPSDRSKSRFSVQICVTAAVKGKLADVGYTAFPRKRKHRGRTARLLFNWPGQGLWSGNFHCVLPSWNVTGREKWKSAFVTAQLTCDMAGNGTRSDPELLWLHAHRITVTNTVLFSEKLR